MFNRRGFLKTILATATAPYIVRADALMHVRPLTLWGLGLDGPNGLGPCPAGAEGEPGCVGSLNYLISSVQVDHSPDGRGLLRINGIEIATGRPVAETRLVFGRGFGSYGIYWGEECGVYVSSLDALRVVPGPLPGVGEQIVVDGSTIGSLPMRAFNSVLASIQRSRSPGISAPPKYVIAELE